MSNKVIVICIVGSEQNKWTYNKEAMVRDLIEIIMNQYPNALFISGDCPYGGVDIWTRETAQNLNKSFKSFPPKKNKWYWYRKRNIEMALVADVVIDIEPSGFTSGGTWTVNYAQKIGKVGIRIEI